MASAASANTSCSDLAETVLASIERRCPPVTQSELSAFAKLTSLFNDDTDCHFTVYILAQAMLDAFKTFDSGTVASLVFNFHNMVLLVHTNVRSAMQQQNLEISTRVIPYRYLSLINKVLGVEAIGPEYGLEDNGDSEASTVVFTPPPSPGSAA